MGIKLAAPLSDTAVRKSTTAVIKNDYMNLAKDYRKLSTLEAIYCPHCGEFKLRKDYYTAPETEYPAGVFPICQKCMKKIVEGEPSSGGITNETKDSLIHLLRIIDKPFKADLYEKCVEKVRKNEKGVFKNVWQQYMKVLVATPVLRAKSFNDSDYSVGGNPIISEKIDDAVIRRWGTGFTEEEYNFLQNEFEDWLAKCECKSKSQEEVFKSLAFNSLERWRARKENRSTDKLEKTFQDLLNTGGLQPKQNRADTLSEGQSLGQLIAKIEDQRPLDPDQTLTKKYADIDEIERVSKIIRGTTYRCAGDSDGFSPEYDEFMKANTVEKPHLEDGLYDD